MAAFIVKSMNAMGYDAMNLGATEFAHGKALVKTLADTADFPLLGANARIPEPIWHPYTIQTVNGLKIGIVGLISPDWVQERGKLKTDSPIPVLRALLPRIKKEADICLVLSHLGYAGTLELVKSVPQIDIAIAGHGKIKQNAHQVGNTVVAAASHNGEYLGRIELNWDPDSEEIISFKGETVVLDKQYANAPEIIALLKQYNEKYNHKNDQKALEKARRERAKRVERLKQMSPEAFMEFYNQQRELALKGVRK